MADGATHFREPGVYADEPKSPDEELLCRLIDWYEAAEDASSTSREKQERDRDYVDNKQLTETEVRALEARGQPPIVLNVIRSRASFLTGMEKRQRRDPKAYPRNNPNDSPAAEAFTDGMRYVVDAADYLTQRSAAFRNISVEGFGGVELAAVPKKNGDIEITISHTPWARMFYDPHSEKPGFEDARYRGLVLWSDLDEALDRAIQGGADEAQARETLETTLTRSPWRGNTYEDKPKHRVWGDQKRKRVRIVMMWYKERGVWTYCEFTQSGILFKIEGPYVDQDGDSYCPWIWESANVDRENNRYGEMRHLIDPQDEVNKRRSKALHQAVSRGVITEAGAVDDVNKARRELAKPDFWIELSPMTERFDVVDGVQLAAGQAMLLQEAMGYIQQSGPNAAMLGKGVEDQSGRAIEAQQAGGLIEQSDLMDVLRRFDLRVFRIIASMIKQYWTEEKWVRVTDDPETPRWVGLNQVLWVDEAGEAHTEQEWQELIQKGHQPQGQVQQPIGEDGQPVRKNDVATMDMDILISDAPETITLEGESYKALMDVLGTVVARGLPPAMLKLALEMHPSLPARRKKQLLEMMEEIAKPAEKPPEAAKMLQLQVEDVEAKIAETRSKTYKNLTDGEKNMADVHGMPAAEVPRPDVEAGLTDAPQQPQGGPPDGIGPTDGMMGPPEMDGPPGPAGPMPEPAPPQGGMGELMVS